MDLTFVLCLPWLVLWRVELFEASGRSLWLGWWPGLALVAILIVVGVIGVIKQEAHGFLPWMIRVLCLVVAVVVSVWIVLSMTDRSDQKSFTEAAHAARRSAEALMTSTSDVREQQALQAVIVAARAGEQLAGVVELAKARGVAVPRVDFDALLPGGAGPDVDRLDPVMRASLEQAMGIAAAAESEGGEGADFMALAGEAGLGGKEVQAGLLAGLAATLGPVVDLAPGVVGKILLALVEARGIRVTKLLGMAAAMVASLDPTGNVDASAFARNSERFGVRASEIEPFFDAVETAGGRTLRAPRTSATPGQPGTR